MAYRNLNPFNRMKMIRQKFRQRDSTAFDPQQNDMVRSLVPFQDLMGNPLQSTVHIVGIHQVCTYFHVIFLRFLPERPASDSRFYKIKNIMCVDFCQGKLYNQGSGHLPDDIWLMKKE